MRKLPFWLLLAYVTYASFGAATATLFRVETVAVLDAVAHDIAHIAGRR